MVGVAVALVAANVVVLEEGDLAVSVVDGANEAELTLVLDPGVVVDFVGLDVIVEA